MVSIRWFHVFCFSTGKLCQLVGLLIVVIGLPLLLSKAYSNHVFSVSPTLGLKQRLSETTCSSVSGDYLLRPWHWLIRKHLRPFSPLKVSEVHYCYAWMCDGTRPPFLCHAVTAPKGVSLKTHTTGQCFNSKLLHTSNCLSAPLLGFHKNDGHQSGSDTVNDLTGPACRLWFPVWPTLNYWSRRKSYFFTRLRMAWCQAVELSRRSACCIELMLFYCFFGFYFGV